MSGKKTTKTATKAKGPAKKKAADAPSASETPAPSVETTPTLDDWGSDGACATCNGTGKRADGSYCSCTWGARREKEDKAKGVHPSQLAPARAQRAKLAPKAETPIRLERDGNVIATATFMPDGKVKLANGTLCSGLRQARDVSGVTNGTPVWLWKVELEIEGQKRWVPVLALQGGPRGERALRAGTGRGFGASKSTDPKVLAERCAKAAAAHEKAVERVRKALDRYNAAKEALDAVVSASAPAPDASKLGAPAPAADVIPATVAEPVKAPARKRSKKASA